MAPKLWELVGTNQLLWCGTLRGVFSRGAEVTGLLEWKIAAPPARVIAFVRTRAWDDLFVRDTPGQGDWGVRALVAAPLTAGCAVRYGPLAPRAGP